MFYACITGTKLFYGVTKYTTDLFSFTFPTFYCENKFLLTFLLMYMTSDKINTVTNMDFTAEGNGLQSQKMIVANNETESGN